MDVFAQHRSHSSHVSGSGGGHVSHSSQESHSNTAAHSNAAYSAEEDVVYKAPAASSVPGVNAASSLVNGSVNTANVMPKMAVPNGTPATNANPTLAVPLSAPKTDIIELEDLPVPPATELVE